MKLLRGIGRLLGQRMMGLRAVTPARTRPAIAPAHTHALVPVRERLRTLRWDGVPRVRNALHHFLGAEVNDYHERCLRTFMLGAVRRVFQPGCKFELMLVLVGG